MSAAGSRCAPADVAAGIVLGGLGAYVLLTASAWTFFDAGGPGPGFFPVIYGASILALSLALVVGGARRRARPLAEAPDREGLFRALGLWAVFVGTIAAMWLFGFALALAALVVFFCRIVFFHSIVFTALAALLAPVAFHIVFRVLLGVELPVGLMTGF